MKTLKIIVSLLILSVLLIPVLALGAETSTNTGGPGITFTGLDDIVVTIGDLLWKIVGIVALIMFVIAGLQFMFAQGDPAKVQAARQSVLWGVVGIVVAILAYSIVAIVVGFF